MEMNALDHALSQNRAEELGPDVWDYFVIPQYFAQLSLDVTRKPRIFVGGRGCGKTMLLRYLSHSSAFSARRPVVPKSEFERIGLYWRADTQFAHAMTRRGIEDDIWLAAFLHLSALVLGREVLAALETIAANQTSGVSIEVVRGIDLSRLSAFDARMPSSCPALIDYLERELWALETWVSNVRRVQIPHFLPGDAFVRALIGEVRRQVAPLSASAFFVYIDEYENLLNIQQRAVNTWIKHSSPPLIFNVAMKRNAFETKKTLGDEAIAEIHDYRSYDLEALDDRFDVFAAEILFMRLAGATGGLSVDVELMRDPTRIHERRSKAYVDAVVGAAARLFPQPTHRELADEVLGDTRLRERLTQRIGEALRKREVDIPIRYFMDDQYPEAAVVAPVLLRRRSLSAVEVQREYEYLREGRDNRLTGRTAWIHNNFVGALLQIYEPLSRPCPLYAGFATYALMAHGNLRHFMELCYKALARTEREDIVPPAVQAEAARQTSASLLSEVKSFGKLGNQLYAFTLRLGSLFALAHARPSQSEPEQNHFAVVRGTRELPDAVGALLRDAVKWSVLYEEPGTKKKSEVEPEGVEYVLNPIYAPYFHISYRKKRRLELSTDDVITLSVGSFNDVRSLLKRFSAKWQIGGDDHGQPLFANLIEE